MVPGAGMHIFATTRAFDLRKRKWSICGCPEKPTRPTMRMLSDLVATPANWMPWGVS